jgi:hypothetical protein
VKCGDGVPESEIENHHFGVSISPGESLFPRIQHGGSEEDTERIMRNFLAKDDHETSVLLGEVTF